MAKATTPMYAKRKLVLGPDGTLQVAYVDVKTGRQLSPAEIKKYTVIGVRNQADSGGRIRGGDIGGGNGGGGKGDGGKGGKDENPDGVKDYNNDGKIDNKDQLIAQSDPYSEYFTRSERMQPTVPTGVKAPTVSKTPGSAYPAAPGTTDTSTTTSTTSTDATTAPPGSYSATAPNLSDTKSAYDQNTRSTEPDSRNNTGFVSGNSFGLNPQTQSTVTTGAFDRSSWTAQDRAVVAQTLAGEIDPNKTDLSTPEGQREAQGIISTIENRAAVKGISIAAAATEVGANGLHQYNAWDEDKVGVTTSNYKANPAAYDAAVGNYMQDPNSNLGYTNYYNPTIAKNQDWMNKLQDVTDIGPHRFGVDPSLVPKTSAATETTVNPQGTLPGYSQMPPTQNPQGYTPTSMADVSPLESFTTDQVNPSMVKTQTMPSNGTTYAIAPAPMDQMSSLGFAPSVNPQTAKTSSYGLDMQPSQNDTGLTFGDFFNPEDLGYSPGQVDAYADQLDDTKMNSVFESGMPTLPSYATASAVPAGLAPPTGSGNATVTGSPAEMAGLAEGPSGTGLGAPGGGNTGTGYGGYSNTTAGDVGSVNYSGPNNVGGFTDGGFHGVTPTNPGISYGGANTVGGYNDGGFHSGTPSAAPSTSTNASVGGYTDGGFHNSTPSSNTGFTSAPTNQAQRAGF